MALDKKLLDIVACPVCKGQLILQNHEGGTEELICKFDRLAYSVEDSIPVLLEDKARSLGLEEVEKVKR